MRALKFITGHVTYNPADTYKFQLKTTTMYSCKINPNQCGLFGQLDMRGGAAARHFGERSLNPPHFHVRPTNSISYES